MKDIGKDSMLPCLGYFKPFVRVDLQIISFFNRIWPISASAVMLNNHFKTLSYHLKYFYLNDLSLVE